MNSVKALLVCMFAMAGCTELTAKRLPPRSIDASFDLTGMQWTSGSTMLMAVKVSKSGYNTVVCGAWALPNSADTGAEQLTDEVLANGEVQVARETVADSTGFFKRARWNGDKLPSGNANCVETDLPWKQIYGTARPRFVLRKRHFTYVD